MSRLYLTPTPNATADSAQDNVSSAIEQTGLINIGGAATENIATENVDLRLRGRVQYGPLLNEKVASELESLAESQYTALPFVDESTASAVKRKRGYYELESADVTPAHPVSESLYEYELRLTQKGTNEDSLRAVATNSEPVDTPFATGSPAEIAIPATATRPRWYSQSAGFEDAPIERTETAQYGDVSFFDPSTAGIDDPTLIYTLAFAREGETDVRVYDDRSREKFTPTATGDTVNVWTHVYHTAYQFAGNPVIDTGRVRIRPNISTGVISASEWDPAAGEFADLGVAMGEYELSDYSLLNIGPVSASIRLTLRDTAANTTEQMLITLLRGADRAIVRPPLGETLSTQLRQLATPFASDVTTDPNPSQDVLAREDV